MVTENSRPIRSFIAIDIPSEVKSGLSALQNSLRHLGAAVSWTRPEGVHLTLKFLGDVDPSSLPDIVKGLHDAVGSATAFPVIVEGVGLFPNPRRPRVLWVGLQGGELFQSFRNQWNPRLNRWDSPGSTGSFIPI